MSQWNPLFSRFERLNSDRCYRLPLASHLSHSQLSQFLENHYLFLYLLFIFFLRCFSETMCIVFYNLEDSYCWCRFYVLCEFLCFIELLDGPKTIFHLCAQYKLYSIQQLLVKIRKILMENNKPL